MTAAQQQLRILLRADMGSFVFGLLVLFTGLAAVVVHLLRLKSKDRTLLWFGLFVGLYGLRAIDRHSIAHILFAAPPAAWRYLDSVITDIIVTPALLLFEAAYGEGWKSSLRWLIWVQAVWGAAAIAADFIRHAPGSTIDPSAMLLIVFPVLVVVGYLRGYRPPQSSWAAIVFAGGAVFLLSVIADHLRDARLTPWRFQVEPIGFLVNLACLGYVAVQHFVTNEQQLVAINEEMKSAARIQASILPRAVPEIPGVRIAVRYLPMTAVAGDFYDFLPDVAGGVGILVADVTGHGVPAALVASMVKMAVSSQAGYASDPAHVITALNQVLCRQVQGQFTTAGYLFVDVEKMTASYAAAGHPPLLLWRKSGGRTLREFRENGLLMGVRAAEKYANASIELEPGDRLLLYTDGIPEASNSAGEFFGEERMAEFIAGHESLPADAFADALLAKLAAWSGGSRSAQTDDVTLVVVDVRAELTPSPALRTARDTCASTSY
jgi:serine phosphatase RsbU (regulator of sigma subunit)